MALGNLVQLQASIAAWATRSDLTAQIPDFIIWAHQEILSKLRANFMLASADVVVSTETVSPPADFLAIRRLYLDVKPRVEVRVADASTGADTSASYGPSTYPLSIQVEGALFRFSPVFTGSATGKLLYYAKPTALVNPTDTNVVLAKYPYLYLYGALEALYDYLEDEDNSNRFGAKFGALIDDIGDRERKDTMSGPLSVGVVSGGVA
jgi:hypothetical protein